MRKAIVGLLIGFMSMSSLANSTENLLVVTNPLRGDGFGAQFQTIIYSVIYAELNGQKFVYTPFSAMEHNYNNDADFLTKKEKLINFIGNFNLSENKNIPRLKADQTIHFFEANLSACAKSSSLKKIKEVFRMNKHKTDYFGDDRFHVAVHIRRFNQHDNRDSGAAVTDEHYTKIINSLRTLYASKNPLFHIYSQGDEDAFKAKFNKEDIILHIDESIENTFTSMVLADALVTSPSSLSYVAAIISNGNIHYIPFWHPPLPDWNQIN